MKKFRGFTLAEVLITLAIIGIVAAVAVPSVISNSQQREFKTGLKKAISVLNSSITMNIALEGESPYDNADLFNYLQRHMSILKTTGNMRGLYMVLAPANNKLTTFANAAFYTTDGMRYEFYDAASSNLDKQLYLYENPDVNVCIGATTLIRHIENPDSKYDNTLCGGCGSYGLNNNTNETTKPPCLIMVDVNGDRKPSPSNVNCTKVACAKPYKLSNPDGKTLSDIFSIMITERQAVPYGMAAQKAMYEAQK